MDPKRRRGFTIVEAVTTMMIVSVLTRIAMPQMQEVLTRARATEVRASFSVVEEAATRLSIENNPWPNDTDAGVVPPELVDMLAILDALKNMKASFNNDFSFYKRAFGFLRKGAAADD